MADSRITHVRKANRLSSHEHITHVGNSPAWTWTRENVIASINAKENTFFVLTDGNRSNVGVVNESGKASYLRTHADGKWNDNLLSLPEC